MVIVLEMKLATRIQNLSETVCIPQSANNLGKYINKLV